MACAIEGTAREQQVLMVQRPDHVPHLQTCPMHRDDAMRVCWGKLKNGDPCTNKAVRPVSLDEVPTCGVHRRLARKSSICTFKLSCGVQCGRTCVFKVHGFQLCPLHQDASTACYLMKIPIELRQRIFNYLLPTKPIPARKPKGSPPPVWLEILSTSRQIHEECIQLLYGTGSFVIEICKDGLSMCYAPAAPQLYRPPPRAGLPTNIHNHALQDYQMQLMLLEQQNKRRLLMARDERRRNGESSRQPTTSVMGLMSSPQPLAPHHFSMIRSFIIEVIVDDGNQVENFYNPNMPADPEKLESTTFDFCDHLHKLIGRLQLQPLTRLQITMRVGENYSHWQDALVRTRFLLEPFRRLRNVAQPDVLSVTIQAPGMDEMELLQYLPEYLHEWSSDLKSSRFSLQSPIFEAYWQLEDMVNTLKKHYRHDSRLDSMDEYLHGARVARENDDRETFRMIWGQVVNVYMDYLNYQKEFQTNMAMTIDRINGLLVG
ncbi:hypothetical protein BKA64DRAFT_407235 [Cadophora sp. MPI-SDFR-AT-0126]|nr:hypothetical protein BKA64DRAFT_407235 [Leotiomycetes sp. MPI-SDFR-AT-0126]